MKNRKFLIPFLLLIFIAFPRLNVKAEGTYINGYVVGTEYSSSGSVPQTIYYNSGGNEGTLYLQYTYVSSGQEPRIINYDSGDYEFTVSDYCQWNKSSYLMIFKYNSGFPPDSKSVTVDGYTFTAYLTMYEKGSSYTKYAAKDMDKYRGTDAYPDEPWIGSSKVVNGQIYHTAVHYWNGRYQGSYTTSDTRKYVGVYAGTVNNHRPINDNTIIEEVPYSDSRGYWVKSGNSFVIGARAYDSDRNDSYRPDKIYYSVRNTSDSYEYGAVLTSASQEMYYYRKDGDWIQGDIPLIDRAFSYESYATSYSRLRTMLRNDDMHVNYWFTSSKSNGGYLEASSWKKMYTINSDGKPPTYTKVEFNNVTPDGFDVDIYGVSDNGGSGVSYIRVYGWTSLNGQDPGDLVGSNATDLGGGHFRYHVNRSDHRGEFGQYEVDFHMYDNVGNEQYVYANSVVLPCNPINNRVAMEQYDYKQDNNNYWVKLGNTAKIYNDGYFPDSYKFYPTANYIAMSTTGSNIGGIESRQWATIDGNYKFGAEYDTYFTFLNTDRAYRSSPDGNNYLYTTHTWKPTKDKTAFKIYHTTTFDYNGTQYFSGYADSGMWLRVDGTPPVITPNPAYMNWTNSPVTVSLAATDIGGSGVKTIYYSWSASNLAQPLTWNSSNSTSVSTTQNNEGKWYLWYYATDNVGNNSTPTYKEYDIDLTKPVVDTDKSSGNYLNNLSVNLTYSDNLSGIAVKQYSWSNTITPGAWNNYTDTLTQNVSGTWYLHYKATDNAGNINTGYFGPYVIYPSNTKPTAAFTVSPNPQLSGQPLTITDNSTVNDSWDSWNSVNGKMWNWRNSTDNGATWSTWQTSDTATKPSSFNVTTKTLFEIRLTVKDTGNILSGPLTDSTTRQVTILPINTKPIANFTVTPSQYINYPLSYADYSSANDYWDSLVAYEWSCSNDSGKTWSVPAAAPPTSFGTPGIYKIRLRVKDNGNSLSPGQWSDYCIRDVEIKDLTILGQVLHTDRWDSNRIKYNQAMTQTDDSPRTYDVFFPGEMFVLKAGTVAGANATKVNVQIKNTSFSIDLTSPVDGSWSGQLWDESMMDWKSKDVVFIFTAYYQNGVVKITEVPIKINDDQYWQQHRKF